MRRAGECCRSDACPWVRGRRPGSGCASRRGEAEAPGLVGGQPCRLHSGRACACRGRSPPKLLDERRLACRPPILELLVPTAQTVESVAFTEGCTATTKRILSYSFTSRRIKQLYPYTLPFPAGPFVLLPGTTKGILNDGTGLEERLRWLTPTRLSAPIRLGLDRVGNLAIPPDGERLAVSAVKGIGGARSARSRPTGSCASRTRP